MNFINIFIAYFFISGIIYFLVLWCGMNFSEDKAEAEDLIADLTWNTGINREWAKYLMYALALLLGFVLLPYEIWTQLTGEEED